MIYNEDCRVTMAAGHVYDYVFAVPPDFTEIGIDPSDEAGYSAFLVDVFRGCKPTTGTITIGLTDRKYNSGIVAKGNLVYQVMTGLGYRLASHKILVKSTGMNLFRLNYTNIFTFGRGKPKQNQHSDFQPDVWMDGTERYDGFSYGMPVMTPKRCILNYTQPDQIVYDPFMGSGTTAVAAITTGRKWIGSEINAEYAKIATKRINSLSTVEGLLS